MIFFLTACAGSDPKPRPGVREAKACMKSLGSSPKDFEAYIIRTCTNTGVWIVETHDAVTGNLETYDFLNKEYTGFMTAGTPTEFKLLETGHQQAILALQKSLNNALLRDYE